MSSDVHTLAGAYALDALTDDERRRFERHLVDCDDCRLEVGGLQATAALLGAAAVESPPPGLRERVLADIRQTPQQSPAGAWDWDGRSRLRPVLGAVAALLAAAVVGLTVVAVQTSARIRGLEAALGEQATHGRVFAVLAAAGARMVDLQAPPGSVARFVWSGQRDEGVFVAEGLRPAPSGRAYALWLLDDAAPPRLAGRFHAGPRDPVVAVVGPPVASAESVGVTVEPEGRIDRPTSEPVIAGRLA